MTPPTSSARARAQDRAGVVVGVADVADDSGLLDARARAAMKRRERRLLLVAAASGRSSSRARSRRSRRRAGARASALDLAPVAPSGMRAASCGWMPTAAQMSACASARCDRVAHLVERACPSRRRRRPRRRRRGRARGPRGARRPSASKSLGLEVAVESISGIAELRIARIARGRAHRRGGRARPCQVLAAARRRRRGPAPRRRAP